MVKAIRRGSGMTVLGAISNKSDQLIYTIDEDTSLITVDHFLQHFKG